jgi:hypothetical protein
MVAGALQQEAAQTRPRLIGRTDVWRDSQPGEVQRPGFLVTKRSRLALGRLRAWKT